MASAGVQSPRTASSNARGRPMSILEADSLYAQGHDDDWEDNADWSSITSSVVDYEYENGRRYHAYKAGHYPLPNDEPELDRLDLQHHVFTLLLKGELSLAPLDNPRRVLDIGTGTGLWAIEFADRYPNATVIGTDLSPVQPQLVPDNVRFEIADVEDDWLMRENYFDLVHMRMMLGSISDHQDVFSKALRHLKPGGQLEIQEMDLRVTSDDGSHNRSKWHVQLFRELCEASESCGKPVPFQTDYGRWMRKAGFVDVKEHFYKLPVNTWPKNKQLKEIGKYQALHYSEGLEGICIGLFTRVLGWTQSELQVLLAKVRSEIKDRTIHVYQPFCVVTGRKPYPNESSRASPVNSIGSNGPTQPVGTATDLRSPQSTANLAQMVQAEMSSQPLNLPRIHIDCGNNLNPSHNGEGVDIDNTPTEASSSNGYSF